MTPSGTATASIDLMMERASEALNRMSYFEAERHAMKALERARHALDFERMSRICLPLQEARRQIRQLATDAGVRATVSKALGHGGELQPGCILLEPPRIGIEARNLRELAARREIPVMILAREPLTKTGHWPIVGVGDGNPFPISVRVKVMPPDGGVPTIDWFISAQEALGDAAIAKVDPRWPADHRVDDFMELLPAVPDHEKLIQALASACAQAAVTGVSDVPRRPGMRDVI